MVNITLTVLIITLNAYIHLLKRQIVNELKNKYGIVSVR